MGVVYTIDSGGGTSTSGSTTLSGSIGQPETGTAGSTSFSLIGGFWGRIVPSQIFADGFESGDTLAWSSSVP